ncbi:Phosphate transport system protein phoU homolog [Chlamydia abortus]|uniref:Phosphate-specific transport system accessory protein PhoU n=1 Tax=Paenibacillus residui TaxID=629724 RepID=A0ABW3D9J8_9BACL|nr:MULTISPECIES: phosphate signaling complex protein PhoU [Paenibacillaceae]SHE09908.1 Phosphate transport system protein phoU homolog [Chlamydia abortus]
MDTRPNYRQSLAELQRYLMKMGNEVEQQIQQAVQSLTDLDERKAKETVSRDDSIDDMMMRIEERCLRLIALQQPMATDLRIIGMTLKIAIDLERIADHAVDIAKVTLRLSGEKLVKPLVDIPRMAEAAMGMVKDSLLAFTERDIQRAAALAEQDDVVDHIYSSMLQEITGMLGKEPSSNRQWIHLLLVANYLERVADHATNIGEGVIYLVTGKRKDLNL